MKRETLIPIAITVAIISGLVLAELFSTCDTKQTGSNPVYSTECQK